MPIVEGKIGIMVTQDAAFDLAQDYYARLDWDPFLTKIEFRDGATQADVGVRVWVRAKNGLSMEVVYVTYDRPRSTAMKMVEGPRMFERFAGTWKFDGDAGDRTDVTFRYNFETRWPLFRPVLNSVIRAVFARDIRRRLEGLKRAAEHVRRAP